MERRHYIESQYALQLAFQIMKERCEKLQSRLTILEEENILLRQQYEKQNSLAILKFRGEDENIIQNQQEKIETLKVQKSQLAQHIFMVASENQQLWERLNILIKTNKSQVGKQVIKMKQHPSSKKVSTLSYSFTEIPGILSNNIYDKHNLHNNEVKEQSLEEISLQLINGIMSEESKVEKQYYEIMELQTNTEINLKNNGLTYPEDIGIDSLEQLKFHNIKLTQLKEELFIQQNKLKNSLYNLKKRKKYKTCTNCKNSIDKLMLQTGTQFDSHYSLKENEATQTSFSTSSFTPTKKIETFEDEHICPLCGETYKKSVSYKFFHEHVINHFFTNS